MLYLKHPLVLVGLLLLLFFGVHSLLIQYKVISPLSPADSGGVLYSLMTYGFIIAFVVIVLGFALEFFRVHRETKPIDPYSYGINPELLSKIPEKALRWADELLDKKNLELDEKRKELEEWARRYSELEQRLAAQGLEDKLAQQVKAAMEKGDLEQAGGLLDEILQREEKTVDQAAVNNFSRAQVYQLQFQPLKALPYLEKAYRYRPENVDYALAYATLLQKQHDFKPAETIYTALLTRLRDLAQQNPAAYLPYVATTLNNLGLLYGATQRLAEAEPAYQEALQIRRTLAQQNPAAYLPDVAMTLNNLGVLYRATQRLEAAEQAYQEALQIRRTLAKQNPPQH